MADAELKKAFTELKNKSVETATRIKAVDNQVEQCKNRGKHAELTYMEVKQTSGATKLYESVGRMFVLETQDTILEQLKDRAAMSRESIQKLENQKVYLSKNLKESENALRELVESKKTTIAK
ncbi:prefoldin subunit 1-like [Bolinopsis microptera]|uniref:prefoldin subunit 1-like n=1 Tax=Bolinopsis microptera TaxID=2820187 RepID=UPI00307AB5D1